MTAIPRCFECGGQIDIDDEAFVLAVPMVIQTPAGTTQLNVFAHQSCGRQHGAGLHRKMVEFVLINIIAPQLSTTQITATTPNLWVGSPAAKNLPRRPYVAVVS